MSLRDENQPTSSQLKKSRLGNPKVKRGVRQVSIGVQFRKVAKEQIPIEVEGRKVKMSRWDAYVRQIYNMALGKNNSAARLLDQIRRQFPGDLLPGDPLTFVISESDAKL